MSKPVSPFESNPPRGKRILLSVVAALFGAAVVLITIVLPAEYNIDPTRIGGALGLTALHAPERTIQIVDVVGGNQTYREVAIPDAGKPVPLPNPAVFQKRSLPGKSDTVTVVLPPGRETEIKMLLQTAQVATFSWVAKGGLVYTDFHGHEPSAGNKYWVRYEELRSGTVGSGSLVAPFAGEHGWFWRNLSEQPVTIQLQVSGYYDKIVDHGIFGGDKAAASK